jgi:predicted Zn-dependent protease with MMP-like domain
VIDVPREQFEDLVADALDAVPEELAQLMDNVAVIVEDHPPRPGLLGLYDGVPQTARADYGVGFVMPDRIFIYRHPICAICHTEDEVVDEVLVTVVHEIAHHFGIDDDRLDALGWG